MAYGHAERNLAALRELEAETQRLLARLDQADAAQSAWLQKVNRRDEPAGSAELFGPIA